MMNRDEIRGAPKWAVAGATALGAGLSPVAPGTVGSLAALALYLPAFWAGRFWGVLVGGEIALALLVSAFVVPPVLCAATKKDPSFVVIDEVAGMLIALAWTAPSPWSAGIAFVLFRAFDILKPFPIGRLERLPGAWGVMADDIAAGAVAGMITWVSRRYMG
jgi:phosphatidylglycerophosphatase A